MKRERLDVGGSYFLAPSDLSFIATGCTMLDLALGGGWAQQRIANIVGDKSTGKTLLAIEACTNFARAHQKGHLYYCDSETAFVESHAKGLGMPIERIKFRYDIGTVEDLFTDLERVLKLAERWKHPVLYVVDSLDALSDRTEMDRDLDERSYGLEKARKMSQLFRRLTAAMSKAKMTLLIVSQVRANIGVKFGRQTTRSGGRALDFYASQVLYLSHLGTDYRTVLGEKRAVGVEIRAKVDKNKVALPFREAQFTIRFGYGVDDQCASAIWLAARGGCNELHIGKTDKSALEFARKLDALSDDDHERASKRLRDIVRKRWGEIEVGLQPQRKKYGETT
jgi:recombination protein RecA